MQPKKILNQSDIIELNIIAQLLVGISQRKFLTLTKS